MFWRVNRDVNLRNVWLCMIALGITCDQVRIGVVLRTNGKVRLLLLLVRFLAVQFVLPFPFRPFSETQGRVSSVCSPLT